MFSAFELEELFWASADNKPQMRDDASQNNWLSLAGDGGIGYIDYLWRNLGNTRLLMPALRL